MRSINSTALALLLAVSTGLNTGCSTTVGPLTALEVKHVLEEFAESAETGDVQAMSKWVSDDIYHWGLESGRIHDGKAELMQALREDTVAGDDFAKNVDPQLVSFRKISSDVVIVDLLIVYSGHEDKHGTYHKEFKEPTVFVFSRKPDGWRIASVYAAGNMAATYQVN